jgi:uncharacterized membrane protein YbaN (DUF454 family)
LGNTTALSDKVKRGLFTVLGTVFLVIGAIGIMVPVLPTTPLLLLAAACYIRGSPRLYHWMLHNRVFGEFLRNYQAGRGIKRRNKATALLLLWGAIGYSVVFVVTQVVVQSLLVLVAIAVSVHLVRLPTYRPEPG